MIQKDLNLLLPRVKEAFLVAMVEIPRLLPPKTTLVVTETLRTLPVQMALFCCGSGMHPDRVRAMFRTAGLWTPTAAEIQREKTRTLESYHLQGRAIDWVLVQAGRIMHPLDDVDLTISVGEAFKRHGFVWGGDWDRDGRTLGWDPGHIEIRGPV